jgi:FKBP-type peptidyl-prolyl cis-trans isomerase FklB
MPWRLVYKALLMKHSTHKEETMKIDKEKVSYVLGQSTGGDFRRNGYEIDIRTFIDSFNEAYSGQESRMNMAEMRHIMMNFQEHIRNEKQKKQMASAEKNMEQGKSFLEENRTKEGVITTESGLQYKIVREGTGRRPVASDTVLTHYEGKTLDGVIFDSSYKRGEPVNFPVTAVIKGWQEALQLMTEGAKWEIFVPSDLAYGHAGSGQVIEPHSTLIFTIELIAVH